MGMIVTLYLISANVYNSVEGPKSKGFSYIEIWMIGTQIPILLALVEYGFILYLKKMSKKFENKNVRLELDKPKKNLDDKIKTLDFAIMIISFIYFIMFASIYWLVASLAIN
jgi:Ca2+/Na+ antiporter